jgi:hypothetical protein
MKVSSVREYVVDFIVPVASDVGNARAVIRELRRLVAAGQSIHLREASMLILGIILLILGFLLGVPVLWTIGIILAVIGAVLWLAEGAGASWDRRWY